MVQHVIAVAACVLALCLALCASTAPTPANHDMNAATRPEKLVPFLMFEGKAEEAMTFYISLFENSRIDSIERFGPEGPGPEGSVRLAHFTLAGRPFMTFDSPAPHPFTFTPSISMFITCESEAEIDRLFESLSGGGQVLMPPDDYGFSKKFAWVQDRFGVSWQLNLPGESNDDAVDQPASGVRSPEQFITAYEAALATQDWIAVEPLIHDRACVTFSNGTVHEGKPAVRAAFERNFSLIKSEQYSISDVRWISRTAEMATYVFDYDWKGIIDGREAGGAGRGTCVLVCEGGQWKMLAEHLGPRAR